MPTGVVSQTTASPPSAPLNLQGEIQDTNSEIKLTWEQPANLSGGTISGYKVERQIANGGWNVAVPNTGNVLTVTDTNLQQQTIYDYRVSAITQIATGAPSNAVQFEFNSGSVALSGTSVAGNTVELFALVTINHGIPDGTLEKIWFYASDPNQSTAFHKETINQVVPKGTSYQTANPVYSYPTQTTDFYARAWITNGETGQSTMLTSPAFTLTPLLSFGGDVAALELRTQDPQNTIVSNYTGSEFTVIAQPAGYDVIMKYESQDPTREAEYFGYEDVIADVTDLIPVEPEEDYYVSIYINPTFDYTVAVNNEATAEIPKGYPSNAVFRSEKDPNSQPQLGIEGMGDFFGLPMVFIFIIGLAAVFTGRSAPMGIVFIVATMGIMGYLGYLSFDLNDDFNNATWVVLIISMIVGLLVGKRWD